jgi:transcriptional regulator with XRE-family HTH domain
LKSSTKSGDRPSSGRGSGVPNPTDVHVGKRIRMRRLFLGMNQGTLANALGLTFQQVQKYEGGANRVSASRLAEMAHILGVSIPYFFAGFSPAESAIGRAEREMRERIEQSKTIELLRFFYGLRDETVRQQFLGLVKAVAAQNQC